METSTTMHQFAQSFCRFRDHKLIYQERNGFTILELLIVCVIGGTLLALSSSAIISHIRTTTRQEASQRLRDDFGRLSFLLETEIGEGDAITFGSPCSSSGFTIRLPRLPNLSSGSAPAPATVRYYNDTDGNLRRVGPNILPSGELDFAASPQDLIVNENTSITVANCDDPRTVSYSLTLSTPPGTYTGTSNSHVKAGEIN